jgi:hypothetical protein
MAIADTSTTQPQKSSGGGLFSGWFSSKPEEKAADKSEGTIDRMARLVGLGKDPKPVADKSKPTKQAAKPTRVASHGATHPKQADASPTAKQADGTATKQAEATPPLRRSMDAQSASPTASAPAATADSTRPASTALNGAVPVVPTGNFDSRWSGFR